MAADRGDLALFSARVVRQVKGVEALAGFDVVQWADAPTEASGCKGVTCWRRLRECTEAGIWPACTRSSSRARTSGP